MSLAAPGEQTVVARLRLSGVVADPLLAKLRWSMALNSAQLAPAGLPPSAIVIVRRLRDPLPGRMSFHQPGGMPPLAWQQAVQQKIASLARRAERPARDFVASAAAAVLFLDRSELLACLARDWIEGTAALRWWWQALLRRQDLASAVLAEWLEHPQQVPAALQQLAQSGHAVRFVLQLTESDTRRMLDAVMQVFGLSALQAVLANLASTSAARQLAPTVIDAEQDVPGAFVPWQQQVPECAMLTMTLHRHCLLGIALMLIRKPSAVAKSAFVQAVQQWVSVTPSAAPRNEVREVASIQAVKQVENAGASESQAVAASHCLEILEPVISAATPDALPEIREKAIKQTARHNFFEPDAAQQNDSAVPKVTPPGGDGASPQLAENSADNRVASSQSIAEIEFQTEFGGIFYLINFGLFLELYGDFTHPARPGIALPVWDFVALLGEGLVGQRIRRDPVWNVLARLAGRGESEQPGHDYAPPDSWRMPTAWLEPFRTDEPWQWGVSGQRLRLHHPLGFAVFDLPQEGDVTEQLQRELAALATVHISALRKVRLKKTPAPHRKLSANAELNRWLGWLIPYAQARLAQSLALGQPEQVVPILFEHAARVTLTPSHLDVFFSLADLPLAVRIAGLDRDPGWVPTAARYVAFHFD